jgi:hypothetical protein
MVAASYIVLQDRPVELWYSVHANERILPSHPFNLDPDAIVGDSATPRERVVLMAQINPSSDADLRVALSFRKTDAEDWNQVFDGSFSTRVNRSIVEVFPASILTWQNNHLLFEVVSGQGKVEISGLVLWYQVSPPEHI